MVTIAKTDKYRGLHYRHLKLVQLFAAFSELRLHTNIQVGENVAKYYHSQIWEWGDYAPFFTASLESMRQVFYIELHGFLGGYWDAETSEVKGSSGDEGSLYKYLYNSKRTGRKQKAKERFGSLLQTEADALGRLYELRKHLAHFEKLNKRNSRLLISDAETKRILDGTAEVIYLLGFRRWNMPGYYEDDNHASQSVQLLIDAIVTDDKSAAMREEYLSGRKVWIDT
jgi:hypothetical protein